MEVVSKAMLAAQADLFKLTKTMLTQPLRERKVYSLTDLPQVSLDRRMLDVNQPQDKSGRLLLLVWAVIATLVAVASTVLSVLLFLQLRSPAPQQATMQASRFLELREDAVAGLEHLGELRQARLTPAVGGERCARVWRHRRCSCEEKEFTMRQRDSETPKRRITHCLTVSL